MGGTLSRKGTSCGRKQLDPDDLELTDREKELVRNTWAKLLAKPEEVSTDIFFRIFELLPRAKQFFPFKNAVGEALLEHPYFKGHSMRFFNAVRMTVVNLDALEVILIPSLLKLGKQHNNIVGFKHEYFVTFNRAMNDVFSKHLGRAYNAETRTAWTRIFTLITSKVEEGYMEGKDTSTQSHVSGLPESHSASAVGVDESNTTENALHITDKDIQPEANGVTPKTNNYNIVMWSCTESANDRTETTHN